MLSFIIPITLINYISYPENLGLSDCRHIFGGNLDLLKRYKERKQTVGELCDTDGNTMWTCELNVFYVVK